MTNNKYKYLFFVPSPRNIPDVKEAIVNTLYDKYDVIWFKYHKEIDAYTKARDYFLANPDKYDYLCILPDDLIINEDGINTLINELENPSISIDKYPVLAGICNLSYINKDQMNKICASRIDIVSENPNLILVFRDNFIKLEELEKNPNENIIQCRWIGFSCEFISREVIEKVPFREDSHLLGLDVYFSRDLKKYSIPQYIHTKAKFVHLKGLSVRRVLSISTNPDIIYTNIYKPFIMIHTPTKSIK